MKLQLFSIFDSAAGRFLPPWHALTVEVAIRRFREAVNQPDSDFSRFPEDYTLFHVGEFDQEDGRCAIGATPHSLGLAITYIDRSRHGEQVESQVLSYKAAQDSPVTIEQVREAAANG